MFDSLHLLRQLCGQPKEDSDNRNIEQQFVDTQMAPAFNTNTLPSRYRAYGILCSAGIPSLIWCEDALEHLGVPTETFCLFLVVPDSLQAQASDHLMKAGYQKRDLPFALNQIPQFSNIYGPPAPSPSQLVNEEDRDNPFFDPEDNINRLYPPVILLPAMEWFVNLPETYSGMQECYPTLLQLFTSLVSKWMVLEEQDEGLRMVLAVLTSIEYIYDYLDVVKQPEFEEGLPKNLRLFHTERVNGLEPGELWLYSYQKRFLGRTNVDDAFERHKPSQDRGAF
ncbi:hypothetical protein KVR01_011541 [Diaporthe batatas]|uniref:uncharacterized protein n=1 Tax=Diaporthe batatas TaxID=748121 RepID=UPI001D04795F|nr:uncharacterized protein KVR01_011541 [Diaporthe batatas]KAG8158419.1 hypothetical protein KVR01_011541 [Diaporthe batatas]